MTPIEQTKTGSVAPALGARYLRHPLQQALWVFLAALLVVPVLAPQAHAAYTYYMPITIKKEMVSSGTLNNFPVLISITSDKLKSSNNGGHVQRTEGYDIVFRASDGTTVLPHELESYTAISGQVTAWVKVPSISSSADTTIRVYYGDASISAATETPASVWDSNFKAVYHLHDDLKDSTSNNNHGTNHSSTNGTGKVADGQAFNGSSYIEIASSSSLLIDTNVTVSAWVKVSSFPGWMPFIAKPGGSRPSWKFQLTSGAQANFTTPYNYPSAGSLSTGTWHLLSGVAQGSTRKIYINGSQAYTASDGGGLDPASYPMGIGGSYDTGASAWNEFFTGSIDEARISNIARSAAWIMTEYRNQSNPGSYLTLGSEQGGVTTYTITSSAGTNGSISPSGTTTVNSGSNQTYTVTADSGFEVNQVLVDGAVVSLVAGQYTFSNVNANHNIQASFSAVVVNPPEPPPPAVPGCGQNVSVHYGGTGFDDADFNLISMDETDQHTLKLNTGYFSLNPSHIVIPFTQEVSVTFFHELAGRLNDMGWMLASEGVNGTMHEIYTGINDGDGDGVLDEFEGTGSNAWANRKSIGTFAGGTEIVFYLHSHPDDDDPYFIYSKKDWNPDVYSSYRGDCQGDYYKIIHLDLDYVPQDCKHETNWQDAEANDRMGSLFGLDFTGQTTEFDVVYGQKFQHVVVGVPRNKPNEWILGWEDMWGAGDADWNDVNFMIERRTGGYAQPKTPVSPERAEDMFTAITAQVWDRIPCPGTTEVKYYVSIDNGANWVEITSWDEIWETNAAKTHIQKLTSWSQGTPEYTHRTVRLDFAGLGLTGRQLTWKVEVMSNQVGCEPEILDVQLDSDIANHAFFSRGAPVVKANVIYSGFYETPEAGWRDKVLRGHLSATRLYAPSNPNATSELALWDAGAVLSTRDPAARTIYFPEISTGQMSNLEIATGDGTARTFTGTISPVPISATTLTITDGRESFRDRHTDVLEGSLGGTGTINRFTGEFSLTFHEAPINNASIRVSYSYYTAVSALQTFVASHVNKAVMGLDDSTLVPSGFVYDFDKNNVVNDNDAHWLMNWVRGYDLGTTVRREWLLDAVDHSVPALQTAPGLPLWYFGTATTEPERTSYDQFMEANKTRRAVAYVGSRSGMLHAFDAGAFRYGQTDDIPGTENRGYFALKVDHTPDYGDGHELWAFIPANLLPRLKNNLLARQNKARAADYDQAYVDASPAVADVYINNAWRTVLLSAEGNGGDTVFCLDVTDPTHPSFLWEFADPDLFRSRSSPSVARIGRILVNGTAKWVAFFVSGKDNRYDLTQYPSVYMIDIATGAVLQRIFLNCEPLGIGGVPSGQPTIVDSDGNGYIDRFYVGTDKGYLYKVNIPDDPSSLKYGISHCVINKDYSDANGNTIDSGWYYQPIYGSPVVVVDNTINEAGGLNYNVKVFYGTGDSPYSDEDINTTDAQYFFLAYVDTAKKGVCSDGAVSLDWYYQLPLGHRVFASAFAAAGMIYFGTSTAETEDPCAADSISNNEGAIFAIDTKDLRGDDGKVKPKFKYTVGNTVTPPLVEDQHLYIKNQSGELRSFGSGKYNNEVLTGGFPQIKVKMWKEIF